jgi:hypothetical protein
MIQEKISRLLKTLETEMVELTAAKVTPADRLTKAKGLVSASLERLKAMVLEHPFASVIEEIGFFKEVKPAFCHWQVYFSERFTIEEQLPFGDTALQVLYLENELAYVERFFRKHGFQYDYYRRGATELDGLYFVRGAATEASLLLPQDMEVGIVGDGFSVPGEFLFSKFRAFEKLREWLFRQIGLLKGTVTEEEVGMAELLGKLEWTGETINLLEVAYGWYFTGQLNGGKASIIDIVRVLEGVFGVSLGKPYRRLAEIRQRKRLSRTKFIDEMGSAILRKLDDEDEYRPG